MLTLVFWLQRLENGLATLLAHSVYRVAGTTVPLFTLIARVLLSDVIRDRIRRRQKADLSRPKDCIASFT